MTKEPYERLERNASKVARFVLRRARPGNRSGLSDKKLDEYIVSIEEAETRAGVMIDALPHLKSERLAESWKIPSGCDRS